MCSSRNHLTAGVLIHGIQARSVVKVIEAAITDYDDQFRE